jgi:hypothetical protein
VAGSQAHGYSVSRVTPVILATQEAKIRRITVQSQPGQIVPRDPISKKPITKIGLEEWLTVKVLSSNPTATKTTKTKNPDSPVFVVALLIVGKGGRPAGHAGQSKDV